MNPEAHATGYLLHTLTLLGYSVPTISEGVRRGLLTEWDWARTVQMFQQWERPHGQERAA